MVVENLYHMQILRSSKDEAPEPRQGDLHLRSSTLTLKFCEAENIHYNNDDLG
jgi:hypothetical protein